MMNHVKNVITILCILWLCIAAGYGGNVAFAQVTADPDAVNKVVNPGFEADQDGKNQSPTGWLTISDQDADADFCEFGWTHSGDYKLTHWKAEAFTVYTYQTINGLADGIYNFEFWYANGEGLLDGYVELKDFGGDPIQIALPTASGWVQQEFMDIAITTGTITIGVYSSAEAGYWINLDDFLLYDQTNPPEVPDDMIENLLMNPGFEEGVDGQPTDWVTMSTNDTDAAYQEGWAHSGSYKLTHWKGSDYQVSTSQTLTGLDEDTYALEFWYANGGLQIDCYVQVSGHGGAPIKVDLPTSDNWFQVKIPNIKVTTGTATIEIYTDAWADYWLNIDDVAFYVDTPYPEPEEIVFTTPEHALKIKGVDISTLLQVEDSGGTFYNDAGEEQDLLEILADHGVNYVRLRIWNDPTNGYCNKEHTLAMATRIKQAGMKFLLDFHYSDSWADPGKQYKPKAWEGLTFEELKIAVYDYTKDVISALKAQGTLPDMVQIGNEITPGMLWEDGRITDDASWVRFAELITSGIQGVNDSLSTGEDVKIMIHIDKGGDNGASVWFYDNLIAQGVDFDIIGLSYYVFWHGKPSALYQNLTDLATRYGKDIVVVELAFPFTLNDADGLENIIHSEDQIRNFGYPATIAGQQQYLEDILEIIRHTPDGKGLGFFYWEPAWLGIPGAGWDPDDPTSKNGWENQGLFNFDGYALKSLDVFLDDTCPPIPPDTTPEPGNGAIPEPSTALLMGVGLLGILGMLLRKKLSKSGMGDSYVHGYDTY